MIIILFYLSAAIAIISTLMAITRTNAAHALLYLVISLLSVAVIFYLMGAPLAAALEVIVYAGAIMVLFVFVIMMLNMGKATEDQEQTWLSSTTWVFPSILCAGLLIQLIFVLQQQPQVFLVDSVSPKQVGILLYGPYLLAVELASLLLLAALVGAFHIARQDQPDQGES